MGTPGDRGEGPEQGGWQSEWQKQGGWQSQWQQPAQEQPPQQGTEPGGWTQTPDGRWVHAAPAASGKATAALVLGILGLVFCPLICSVLALVFGYQGRKEVDTSGGRISGRGLAVAGIVLGWVGLVIWGLLVALGVIGAIVDDGTSSGAPTGFPA